MCAVWWCGVLRGVLCIAVVCAGCVLGEVLCLACVECAWCEDVNNY